jgi:hypothetical protein
MKTALWAAVMTAMPGVVRRVEDIAFQVVEPKVKLGPLRGSTVEVLLQGYTVELLRADAIFFRAVIELNAEGRARVAQFTGDAEHEAAALLLELFH